MRHRAMLLCALVVTFAGCGGMSRYNPLASACADSCYKLEGSAKAECLSKCNKGR